MEIKDLTTRQRLTITHLISSSTIEEACKKAKISKGTVYIWLKERSFKEELKRQQNILIETGFNRLKYALTKAVDGLIGLMDSRREDLRRWVYKDIIDYVVKNIEIEDIKERLDKIEEFIKSKDKDGR